VTPTRRTSTWSACAASIALLVLAAGCSNSGRELPPAGPNQTQSIVTTTIPSTTTAASGDETGDTNETAADEADGVSSDTVDDELTIPAEPDSGDSTDSTSADGSESTDSVTGVADSQLPSAPGPLSVTVPWTNDGQIPVEFTCNGAGLSPAISWTNVMPSSKEVALVFTDPDASDFVHWVIWGIPSTVTSLPAGIPSTTFFQATNGFGKIGYGAPCPPTGSHTYVLTLYELSDSLTLPSGSPAADVIAQLDQADINSVAVTGQAGS
jgi:Raf kinase inhibitor-like YbhB/YbcL family protein